MKVSYLKFRLLPSYLKFRLLLGTFSLIIGLLAANFALFEWHNPDGSFYLLGEYARYVCAYGGFAATIFGAMLINDFFVLRASIASKRNTKRNATAWLIRARTEWQLCKDFEKYCSMEPKLSQLYFFLDTEEELEVVAQ
jgi:hypothetical protein